MAAGIWRNIKFKLNASKRSSKIRNYPQSKQKQQTLNLKIIHPKQLPIHPNIQSNRIPTHVFLKQSNDIGKHCQACSIE